MFTLIAQAAETTQAAAETGGIGALGINLSSLIFQLVNFAILLWLLKKFAYKPILKVLQTRRDTIEESLRNAQDIATTKAELEQEKSHVLRDAQAEARNIVTQAKERSDQLIAEAETTATRKANQLLEQANAQLAQDIQQARQSLQREVVELVVATTEQLIQQKLDSAGDNELAVNLIEAVRKGDQPQKA